MGGGGFVHDGQRCVVDMDVGVVAGIKFEHVEVIKHGFEAVDGAVGPEGLGVNNEGADMATDI